LFLIQACIDVREAVVFWAMMRTLTELHSFPTELRWISTHPAHGDREKNLNEKMPAALKLRHDSGVRYPTRIQFINLFTIIMDFTIIYGLVRFSKLND